MNNKLIKIVLVFSFFGMCLPASGGEYSGEQIVVTPLLAQEIGVIKDYPQVQFVKNILDYCVAENYQDRACKAFASSKIPVEDLLGKFAVLKTRMAFDSEWLSVSIMSADHPENIFDFSIQRVHGAYELHRVDRAKIYVRELPTLIENMRPILENDDLTF